MSHSPRQKIGDTIRKARSRNRMEQLRQHAAEGHSIGEAASAIGITIGGARTLLYETTGSTVWPPKE